MLIQDTLTQRAARGKIIDFPSSGGIKSKIQLSIDATQLLKKNMMHTKLQSLNIKTEASESFINSTPNSQSFLSPHRKLINNKSKFKSEEKSVLILDEREKKFLIDTFKKKSPKEMQQIISEQKKQYEQEQQIKQKELEKVQEEYNQYVKKSGKMNENIFKDENEKLIEQIQQIEEQKNTLEQMIAESQITLESIQLKEFSGDQEKLNEELEKMWRQFKLENKKEYNDFKREYNPLKLNVLIQY